MSKRIFSDIEQDIISKNINVLSVSSKSITYHPSFKLAAVSEYYSGKAPMKIFKEAGFDINMIGNRIPVNALARWRKIYDNSGESGLISERRGRNNIKSNIQNLSYTEKLKKAEAKIAYLEAELEFLKKLEVIERKGIK